MKWMWSDESAGSRPTGNATLAGILVQDEQWKEIHPSSAGFPLDPPSEVKAIYPGGSFVVRPITGSNIMEQAVLTSSGEEKFSQPFYYLHTVSALPFEISDLEFDSEGYLWALTTSGIQLLDQNGRVRGIISLPHGQKFTAMRITGDGKVLLRSSTGRFFERRLNVTPATPGFTPKSQGQG